VKPARITPGLGNSETSLFLNALCAGKPDELHLLIWTARDKVSHWFQDAEEAIRFIASIAVQDVYVGVGFSPQDFGASKRCVADEIAGIVGMWADIDIRSEAHPQTTLPGTIEQALSILPPEFPPTFVILTGNGIQAWWLFREPWIFETEQERGDAASLASSWQTLLRLNGASQGWAIDRLADLARVLRVPGTRNCKDPANPKPVEIHLQTDRHYNPSDLAEYLEEQGIPDAEAQEQAAQAWKEKFVDKPLAIDPSATVPRDLLDHYLTTDPRFKKTWLRQREDLKDQSQSGYDLALANFGSEAGLSEQQVVDLMIHHRRIHSQRPRTRLDYFQRTIAKAFKRRENTVIANPFEAAFQVPGPPVSQTKTDPATARALLCDQISNAIGVRVLRIVKIDGQEPTYRVELETTKIGFPNVDQLVGQQKFRMKIAGAAEHLVPRIPDRVWDRIAQMMLSALTVEDGGDEATLVGAARMYVERYLAETPFIDAEAEQTYQTRFKPTVYEGQIAIRAFELQQHINKASAENRPIKEVTAMLSALGATNTRLKRTRLRDQTRWLLPPDLFPPESASREERNV
jgi:hypothetical protein